mmetsp:Transcript_57206/g.160485  ORF Transcript_57206/g.160485 Transcript_57206/m.160485 type:complete len:250 (+) Transcript_57206:1089-1838(+)
MTRLEQQETPLVLDGLHHQAPRLLLDLDQLGDVLVLEAGPSAVQGDEGVPQLRPRRPPRLRRGRGGPRPRLLGAVPAVQQHPELGPRLLQRLCPAHRLGSELELVAVDPNHRVLLDAGFEHVHTVGARLVGKQGAVVDREGYAVGPRRCVQAHRLRGRIEVLEEERACVEARLALRVHTAAFDDQLPMRRRQANHRQLLAGSRCVEILAQQLPQHRATAQTVSGDRAAACRSPQPLNVWATARAGLGPA